MVTVGDGHRARVRHRGVRDPRLRPPRGTPRPRRRRGDRLRHGLPRRRPRVPGELRDGATGREILDRRVGRDLSSEEAQALAAEVNETLTLPGATFDLRATVEHRGALVIRADEGRRSPRRSRTPTPRTAGTGTLGVALETFEPVVARCEPLEDTDEAHHAAELTNAFVEGVGEDPRRLRGERGAPRRRASSRRT